MATAASMTVAKAFRILELFREHPVLTSSLCQSELGIPRPTAHRLLMSLRNAGAVEMTEDGHYRLSLSLFELGSLASQRRRLGDSSGAALERLADHTGLRVHLGVRRETHVLYLEAAHGRHAQSVRTRVGERGPLHATALGKVLLAHAPEDVVQRLTAGELHPYTQYTVVDEDTLRADLEIIRACGCAFVSEEYVLGMCSLSAPIRGSDGRVRAAISIAGSKAAVGRQRLQLEDRLRRTAVEIGQGRAWWESYQSAFKRTARENPPPAAVC